MGDRLVYESKKTKVFRRQDDVSGMVTAVKALNYEFPTPADIAQFHNEFDIISGLDIPGIRGAVRKTRENNRHVIEMEWVEGENLKTAFRQKSGDIVDVLHIAIATAGALAEIITITSSTRISPPSTSSSISRSAVSESSTSGFRRFSTSSSLM